MYKKFNILLFCGISLYMPTAIIASQKITGAAIAMDTIGMIGKPYIWGGESNEGVDCSGLVKFVYKKHKIDIPRTATQQISETKTCPIINNLKEVEIGDALYFKNKKGMIHHVAIVSGYNLGRPIIIHAKGKEFGVIQERMDDKYIKEFIGAKQFYNCIDPNNKNTLSENNIANTIEKIASQYNIGADVVYTLISIESNFVPYVITIETTSHIANLLEKLRTVGLKIVAGGTTFHSKKAIVNIYPTNMEMAIYLANIFFEYKFSFDVGLMQIHSTNFTAKEIKHIFNPHYNIDKGVQIFKGCGKNFVLLKNQIECYNRGKRNLSKFLKSKGYKHPYYSRYKVHHKLYFKEQQ